MEKFFMPKTDKKRTSAEAELAPIENVEKRKKTDNAEETKDTQ